MKLLVRIFIRSYQRFLSPIIHYIGGPGTGCRYQPTCSQYFLDAVENCGFLRGSWLGVCRIARCNPWGGFGYDPAPSGKAVKPIGQQAEHDHAVESDQQP
jgi:uncharacterized protein